MLRLPRIRGFSSVENVGGKCWQFDRVANFQGGSFCKRFVGTVSSCVVNSLRDASSDDSFNEKLCERRRLWSFKRQLVSTKSSQNVLISSRHPSEVFVDGFISKDIFLQDLETNFDYLEQLVAEDGRLEALVSPQSQRNTSPKVLRNPKRKSKIRISGTAMHQEFPYDNRNEYNRRDLACEIGTGAFVMEDGESYTSFSIGKDGLPIVCNSRGCRPLSESEKQSPLYIAHLLRSTNGREIDSKMLGEIEQKFTHVQDNFPRQAAHKSYERAKLLREVHGDMEATEDSFNSEFEAPLDDSVLASYAWLLWDEVDDS